MNNTLTFREVCYDRNPADRFRFFTTEQIEAEVDRIVSEKIGDRIIQYGVVIKGPYSGMVIAPDWGLYKSTEELRRDVIRLDRWAAIQKKRRQRQQRFSSWCERHPNTVGIFELAKLIVLFVIAMSWSVLLTAGITAGIATFPFTDLAW